MRGEAVVSAVHFYNVSRVKPDIVCVGIGLDKSGKVDKLAHAKTH